MKWIATHIWDFISRFRNDVYLESLDTSSETGVLVVDSDGKVTKNTGISGGAASSLSDGSTSTGDTFTFTSANTTDPLFIIKNTTNDANGARLRFVKDKGAAGANNDDIGLIEFYGDDANQDNMLFARVKAEVAQATNGQEGGRLTFGVASHDGSFVDALSIGDYGNAVPFIQLHGVGRFISAAENDLITWEDDGLTGLIANTDLDIGDYDFRAQTFTSDVATGTAPFTVSSTTQVANLNAATAGSAAACTGNSVTATTANALASGTSTGDTFTFTSANANDPLFVIQNTTNDSSGPRLKLFNNRGAAGVDDDLAGSILFAALNDGSSEVTSGRIECQQITKTANAEESKFSFYLRDGDASSSEVLDLNSTTSYLRSNLNVSGPITCSTSSGASLFVNHTSDTGTPFIAFTQNGTRRSFIQHHDTDDKFRFASEFGALSLEAASSGGSDSNTAYLVIDPGGTFTLGAQDSDVVLTTDGNMTFRIDADNDETSQKFAFQNNASTEIANLDESGNLQIDGDLTVGGSLTTTNDYHSTTFENQLADDVGTGKILKYSPGANDTLNGSEIYFLHTDGTWDQTDADDVATGASQMLGVGLGGSSQTVGVLIEGFIRIASTEILNTPGSGAVDGLPLYVSKEPGHFDFNPPTGADDFVRVVGYAIDDDGGDVLVYFNPDKSWVKLTVGS